MCSFLPVSAPKSQLAVEQPLTEGHWNPPRKDTTHPKTNCNDMAIIVEVQS